MKEELKQVLNLPKSGRKELAELLDIPEGKARNLVFIRDNYSVISEVISEETLKMGQKLAASKQKFQDINRIERKLFRDDIRLYNALSEQTLELTNLLKHESFKIATNTYPESKSAPHGIFHISDPHGNELVSLPHNMYDFTIMSKRVEKQVKESIKYFKSDNVTNVTVCMTGDMLNSDRRKDEIVAMATNRSCAQFLVAQIYINAMLELNQHFNIFCSYADGNESRVGEHIGFEDTIASDTYDTAVYNICRMMLDDKKGFTFDDRLGAKKVISVNGQKVLLIHGHQKFGGDPTSAVGKLVAQYAKQGINLRYVLFGHLHQAVVSELFARSGSTVGANAYSEDGLGLSSRASQNAYKVWADGRIDGTMIDLQDYDGYLGYPIQKELEMYNVRSAEKVKGVSIYETVLGSLH
jgi:hypothetical protein